MDARSRKSGERGSMLMEVLLMLAILIAVFPIIQKNIKERSDRARNDLVVKDMMRIKSAVENYLELSNGEKPGGGALLPNDCGIGATCEDITEVESADLHKWFDKYGLSSSIPGAPNPRATNIVDQKYTVRIRKRLGVSEDGVHNISYDAIITADGNSDLGVLRIRDIVNASKGFGGYIESNIIYGANWSLDSSTWDLSCAGPSDPDCDTIVFKAGSQRRDYQYITRTSTSSNTMHTDLYMNYNNIVGAGSLAVSGKAEASTLTVDKDATEAKANEVSVDETLTLKGVMEVMSSSVVAFPSGIDLASAIFKAATSSAADTGKTHTSSIALENDMHVGQTLTGADDAGVVHYLRDVRAPKLERAKMSGNLDVFVGNTIETPQDDGEAVKADYLVLNSAEISPESAGAGFTFNNIGFADASNSAYIIDASGASSTFKGHDVIVRDVNSLFTGTYAKYGGVDITEKTPLSMVIRALNYAYADLYKLANNDYYGARHPVAGIGYSDCRRCYMDAKFCDGILVSQWDSGTDALCTAWEDGSVVSP
ncbi:MAG: hypothetical protein LBI17_03230 [Rickettsiales bacterium]|jgi:hypothetical protein|nr:hypothetical protein [Rickettsiales bacterium]